MADLENQKQTEEKPRDSPTVKRMWMLLPIATPLVLLMGLFTLLGFLCKVGLLFIIAAIHIPFFVTENVVLFVYHNLTEIRKSNWGGVSDSRVGMSFELKVILPDFFRVVLYDLLLFGSTGIITFYTAPVRVFYISTAVWVVAILHKWLNTKCLSKAAFSSLCELYGLNPMMVFFSVIGFFDIGSHPIAKFSFRAKRAFWFEKENPGQEEDEEKEEEGSKEPYMLAQLREMEPLENRVKTEKGVQGPFNAKKESFKSEFNAKKESFKSEFNEDSLKQRLLFIDFSRCKTFQRGYFQLTPRIEFSPKSDDYILNSYMVLKLGEVELCKYHVERLELPEDFEEPKHNELLNFLALLAERDGFVTDKMRGRYEHCFTLWEIVRGVEDNKGYKSKKIKNKMFRVTDRTH